MAARILTFSAAVLLGLALTSCGGPVTGAVLRTEGDGLVVSVGRKNGLQEGDVFWVWRKLRAADGGSVTARVGIIRIVEILDDKSSVGKVFYGEARSGDEVQLVPE